VPLLGNVSTILVLPLACIAAIATIASAVIAFVVLTRPPEQPPASKAAGAAAAAAHTPHAFPARLLPDPCQAPGPATLDQFHLDARPFQQSGDSATSPMRSCSWSPKSYLAPDPSFQILYEIFPPARGTPVSIPGLRDVTAATPIPRMCQIEWPVSFGMVEVIAQTPADPSRDPCVAAEDWILAVLPSLPR
jgi:hypothetical protein